MSQIFRFSSSVQRDPAIDAWMKEHSGELGAIARHWFDVMRERGSDVRELLHDGHPTACVADAAFAYVNAFRAHVKKYRSTLQEASTDDRHKNPANHSCSE